MCRHVTFGKDFHGTSLALFSCLMSPHRTRSVRTQSFELSPIEVDCLIRVIRTTSVQQSALPHTPRATYDHNVSSLRLRVDSRKLPEYTVMQQVILVERGSRLDPGIKLKCCDGWVLVTVFCARPLHSANQNWPDREPKRSNEFVHSPDTCSDERRSGPWTEMKVWGLFL